MAFCYPIYPCSFFSPVRPFTRLIDLCKHSPTLPPTSSPLLHALCANGAIYYAMLHGKSPRLPESPSTSNVVTDLTIRHVLLHRAEALRLLRAIFDSPTTHTRIIITDEIIVTIIVLRSISALLGLGNEVAIHDMGFYQLVESRGLTNLDENFKFDIMAKEIRSSYARNKAPRFKLPLDWKIKYDDYGADEVPFSGFEDEEVRCFLSDELLKVLRFLSHVFKIALSRRMLPCQWPDLGVGSDRSVGLRTLYLTAEHTLLSLPFIPRSQTPSSFEEPVRLATLLFYNLALWSAPPYLALMKTKARELYNEMLPLSLPQPITDPNSSLLKETRQITKGELKLRYWILDVGIRSTLPRHVEFMFFHEETERTEAMGQNMGIGAEEWRKGFLGADVEWG
ncbi:MAG: hypothetical protein M1834_003788 [Cirrosporium novae-zelandiae]|nr:MAG: hypothetical protein M1834_003788 [Cirrosporium novae-zelandiae]